MMRNRVESRADSTFEAVDEVDVRAIRSTRESTMVRMRHALLPVVVIALLSTGCHWFGGDKPVEPTRVPPAALGETVDLTTPVVPTTKPAKPEIDPLLLGTTWTLSELDGAPAMIVQGWKPATIQLSAENARIVGSTGVNRFSGTYTLGDGTALKLNPGAMTRMAGPELLNRQEAKLLDALVTTTSYRVAGGTLELLAGERVVARYMKLDAEMAK